MKKLISVLIFSLGLMISKAQTFNPLLSAMLQDTFDYYVSVIPNIKGMQASVQIPGQGIWTRTGGISYQGVPVTNDMQMGIASNTKLFVSTIMLKLAERNKIKLQDSIKKWITITNPNINPNINIRQLLNHTSGISDPLFTSPWVDTIKAYPNRKFTNSEVLKWVGAPLFQAGQGYGYSNINYIIAGMIAESSTGNTISQLIRDSILNPLGLTSTFYDVDEAPNGVLAHRWWNGIDYHDTSRVGLNSAGGCAGAIFSNSADMVKWYQSLFSGNIISKTSLNLMSNFIVTGTPNYQYGLGLSRETTQG